MAYTPTVWENDETELNETNMNHIEQGIKDNDDKLQGLTSMGDIIVDSIRSKNMFNNDTVLLGYYYDNEGTLISNSANALSDFIEVKSDNSYTISCNASVFALDIVEFDSSKSFIKRNIIRDTSQSTITTSSTTKYIRCTYCKDNSTTITNSLIKSSNIQLEEGTTVTTYSPYQNLTGEELYSTNEIKIGTWIDGKPLYRKIYTATSLINDGAEHFIDNVGLSNIDWITSLEGFVEHNNDQYFQFNWINFNFNQRTYWQYKKTTDQLIYATDISTTRVVFMFEYTKTTD